MQPISTPRARRGPAVERSGLLCERARSPSIRASAAPSERRGHFATLEATDGGTAGIIGFGEALVFQTKIGRKVIEERSRSLAQALMAGLRRIEGVHLWTHPDPARSGAVVTFRPGDLDIPKLSAALYQNDRIGCATRTGRDRPGIRLSPHIYNTMAEVDRAIDAMAKYMKQGV
jgi:selenocysteine lyase/cysteine desulfurase